MRRIVLDTSVVISALRSRFGASNTVLRMIATGDLVALATPALFLEYEDVLKRAEQREIHGLGIRQIDGFLAALASAMEPVKIHVGWRPQLKDPSDEMVLEAAINGYADAIVTFNLRDFEPAKRFGLSILRPGSLLSRKHS